MLLDALIYNLDSTKSLHQLHPNPTSLPQAAADSFPFVTDVGVVCI